MEPRIIGFRLNGDLVKVSVLPQVLLVDLLRDELGLTGTKSSCRTGACGACSVLVDDELVSACLLPAFFVENATIWTIEGLSEKDAVTQDLQRRFVDQGAVQCGYCTPGQVVAGRALLATERAPERHAVCAWMSGNLCRCTGYTPIIDAVAAAGSARPAVPIGERL